MALILYYEVFLARSHDNAGQKNPAHYLVAQSQQICKCGPTVGNPLVNHCGPMLAGQTHTHMVISVVIISAVSPPGPL